MAIEIPESLIEQLRAVEAVRTKALAAPYSSETWQPWLDASAKFQAAVTSHAETAELNRYELEKAVKVAALHPAEGNS